MAPTVGTETVTASAVHVAMAASRLSFDHPPWRPKQSTAKSPTLQTRHHRRCRYGLSRSRSWLRKQPSYWKSNFNTLQFDEVDHLTFEFNSSTAGEEEFISPFGSRHLETDGLMKTADRWRYIAPQVTISVSMRDAWWIVRQHRNRHSAWNRYTIGVHTIDILSYDRPLRFGIY